MSSMKSECRKFSPNIFNKTKCQNCFRGKDAHSSEALESNRATRKVSCCGYLFVAPGWDFSLPANRNKRWQRRWFVLYDDGELAYSLDEHPETVPQAVIDMNCVLEVSDAESVTGNPHALAVTCPDKVHFIKGMTKEESKKWFEVLSKFPRNTVCGKYKRNATFPCIKATTVENAVCSVSSSRRDTVEISNYSKHNGYSLNRSHRNQSIPFDPDEFPTKDTNNSIQLQEEDKKEDSPVLLTDNLRPDSKCDELKKFVKGGRKARSDVSKMIPDQTDWQKVASNPLYLLMADVPTGKKIDSYENFSYLRRQASFGKRSDLEKEPLWSDNREAELKNRTLHKSASVPNAVLHNDDKILLNGTNKSMEAKSNINQVRGDPDGCNLDSLPSCCTSTPEFTDQNTEGGVFLKKGWLVKQDECKWNKYWFVLRNSALAFYTDPIAEDAGILDGVLDLRKLASVQEVTSNTGHTFCLMMKDFSKLYLSAVTSKIRSHWIRALLAAANLKTPPSPPLARHTTVSRVKARTRNRFRLPDSDTEDTHKEECELSKESCCALKEKVEECSWGVWLDVSKFCKEVESKLEEGGEAGALGAALARLEERLRKVQAELDKLGLDQTPSRLSGDQLYRENRRLKGEVREAQAAADDFELRCLSLRQAGEQAERLHRSQMQLMVARVDDLTGKLLASEKVVRQLRQRVSKLEQRQERRRSSLKGKEALSLSKEYETKLAELEQKIDAVEGVLRTQEQEPGAGAREAQSLLMRLHNLDKKVKEVAEEVPKPKIRLQVDEDWNSLSLSASMTDLSSSKDEDEMPLSFRECVSRLGEKTSSLVSWVRTSLQLLYAQKHIEADFEASDELGRLVRALDHVTAQPQDTPHPPRLLYDLLLLQEVANVVCRLGDFHRYKSQVLCQHLHRVRAAISGVERYIRQKSDPAHAHNKTSLCHVVACLLFYRGVDVSEEEEVSSLLGEAELERDRACAVLSEFKSAFIERFCTTISELSSEDEAKEGRGQKQFLAHISHIVAQVSSSFVSHVSRSLCEVHFLCAPFQYGARWAQYLCELLRQELSLLAAEIRNICLQHLQESFFCGSKCGVLLEYMHCSISELAQIVAIATVAEGTLVLVKDALSHPPAESEGVVDEKASLRAFHESLRLRSLRLLSRLPECRFPDAFFSLCNPDEVGVAHRSVSSLLCARRRPCKACTELRQEVSYLQAELEESRTLARTGSLCEKCRTLKLEVERHRLNLADLEAHTKGQIEHALQLKEKQLSEEKVKLEQELEAARNTLKGVQSEYDAKLRDLQAMYEQKLQQKHENIQDDFIKQRYSEEIEQLKCLCERGLSAMDASHQKIVCELESRHQRELEELSREREKALAQEAHATHIALEAVRAAHSAELQRQVEKFKEEFVSRMNKRFETEAFKKCYESDLSSVKVEISSLTEKYSLKCLENATLQEKLQLTTHQLQYTTTQVVELLAQNQQLQAHLTSGGIQKQGEWT